MNDERDNLVEKLREIASGSRRNKTARLREIFDDIEAAKAAGASNKTIVDELAAHGLIFDVNNFKNARSRILKERTMEALAQATLAVNGSKSTCRPPTALKPRAASVSATSAAETPVDLVRPPAISNSTQSKNGGEAPGENPLRALSGKLKEGDYNPIPTAKFEVDNS